MVSHLVPRQLAAMSLVDGLPHLGKIAWPREGLALMLALLGRIVSMTFVGLSLGALLFFAHKVVWLWRYKQMEGQLLRNAAKRLTEGRDAALPVWQAFTRNVWQEAAAKVGANHASAQAFFAQKMAAYDDTLRALKKHRKPATPTLLQVIEPTAPPQVEQTLLELPDQPSPNRAELQLTKQELKFPTPPDKELYALNLTSRYGFFRRALVFCAGFADVVVSSHHVSVLSRYAHVPLSVIIRRLSLVSILVIGIALEVVVGLRKRFEPGLVAWMVEQIPQVARLSPKMQAQLGSATTLVLWTAMVGCTYFTLYLILRRRYRHHLQNLDRLQVDQKERLEENNQRQSEKLRGWLKQHGKTLDVSVELACRHISTLAHHHKDKAARRLASPRLLTFAHQASGRFFENLPEASGALQEKLSTRSFSLGHFLWPKEAEMSEAIAQARYRDAWQSIELTRVELRRGVSDPERLEGFFEELVTYGHHFPELFDQDTQERLEAAYREVVEALVLETSDDWQVFEAARSETLRQLQEQLSTADGLVAARVHLVNDRMEAELAQLQSEILHARERARLEAMAFEI